MSIANGEITLNRKFLEMIKLLNIYLNHFPNHEKYALSNQIRNTAYNVYGLELELSHWHIQKVKRGLNFVGYKTFKTFKVIRKHSLYKFKKAVIRKKVLSLVSIVGHSKRTKSLSYLKEILEKGIQDYEKILPQGTIKCLNM